jgi:hypothetical protein
VEWPEIGGHAGVVHGDDGQTHEKAGRKKDLQSSAFGEPPKGDRRSYNGEEHGQKRQVEAVSDIDTRPVGEHRDEVHRPDAGPHHQRRAQEPMAASRTVLPRREHPRR